MQRDDSAAADGQVERVERALEALTVKRAANEAMRKAAHDLPSATAHGVLSRLERDESRLSAIVVSLMAIDDRLGLFFRYRYVEGKSMKRVCQYFTIGRSTGARWKARLVERIAERPDLIRAIEEWSADKVTLAPAGRHKPTRA